MYHFLTLCAIIFGIAIEDIAVCKPYLTGSSLPIICPGSNATFVWTCRDSQVLSLTWTIEADYDTFATEDIILFTPRDVSGKEIPHNPFTGILVDKLNVSNTTFQQPVADLVSTLTVSNKDVSDVTIVTCTSTTVQRNQSILRSSRSSITLILAEKPRPTTTLLNTGSTIFQGSYNNLVQFLATLFKGSAIDYYNISISAAEETFSIVNTHENLSDPTWLRNVTELNVTAHNCAGKSDPVTVYIYHGCDQPLPPINGSVNNETTELGGRITFRCNDGFLPSEIMTAVCQTFGWSPDPAFLECFPKGCEQPLPPKNGSVNNETTELGGRITFRCNDGFLPSEIMTAVCQTTGWSPDPALLECFPRDFNSDRRHTNTAIGFITIPVVVGTSSVVIITFVVVASIYKYVGRAKRKRHQPSSTISALENISCRSMPGDDGIFDVQPVNSSSLPSYSHPLATMELTNNPAYEVCQQRTHLSHVKNLSQQEPEYNMDNNPLTTT